MICFYVHGILFFGDISVKILIICLNNEFNGVDAECRNDKIFNYIN